jgi:hypothetical protein
MPRRELRVRGQYIFFWSEWPSNWEQSPFTIDGQRYGCVEQWMMAEKARLFGDAETERRIMEASHPKEQKALGRAVKGYIDGTWAKVRYGVVLMGTLEKYRQNADLREKLLATGDLTFVEASPYDTVWGIGMRADAEGADDPSRWKGQNLLGRAITEARGILRVEYKDRR